MSFVSFYPPQRLPALVLAVVLGGCVVGPDYHAPDAPTDARFTEAPLSDRTAAAEIAGGSAQRFSEGRDIPGEWWGLFRSPQVTTLVTQALAANPDMTAAQATLRQARETTRAGQGAFFPQVDISATEKRQQVSLAALGFGTGSKTYSVLTGAVNVSYTLDAFGGVRRQVEQLNAQAEYQRFQLEATGLTLAANVINTAINEASLQAQIDTTRAIIKSDTDALNLVQQRFQLGGISQVEVLQQQSLLDSQVATLPGLQKQLQQQRNQLAAYLGGRPSGYAMPTLKLNDLTLPDELPVSLPSQLVEQRPDIRAYSALLHAAYAGVGIATANMLPQISLSAAIGRDGNDYAGLFTPASLVWNVAANLAQPVFQGGTLSARRRASQAALEVAAAQYSSTVNVAFQNVADALVAIERDADTLRAALATQKTAAASLAVAKSQYQAGAGTYLNVLTAEQADYSARLTLISAQTARFTDTVALFQALGGGWWNRDDVDLKTAQCCGVLP
jgi:NodT family efflux transporter outer membrane factor (OMF) lipoprotein